MKNTIPEIIRQGDLIRDKHGDIYFVIQTRAKTWIHHHHYLKLEKLTRTYATETASELKATETKIMTTDIDKYEFKKILTIPWGIEE